MKDTMEAGARTLYRSLQRFRELPGYLQILPGHGAGSACGKALGAVPTSTLGYELLVNWAFQCESEDDFVRAVLRDQPEPPRYFAEMKRMNRDGPPLLGDLPEPRRLDPSTLPALVRDGATVVDTRARAHYAEGHVPGTLNLPRGGDFPTWAGWYLPYDRPIHLVAEGPEQAREAKRDLALIGIDQVAGWFDADALAAWQAEEGPLESYPVLDWAAAERAVADDGALLVDVRNETEWNEGHAPGAYHLHLGHLKEHADELPRDRRLLLYCRSGNRSGIGVSVLQREGFDQVANVEGGIVQRRAVGLPVE